MRQGIVVVLGGLGLAAAVSCGPSWQSKALVQLNTARDQENADYALLRVYPSCDGAPEDARCGPVMPYLMTAEARSGFRERVCGPKGLDAKSCEDLWLGRVQRELLKRYSLADWQTAQTECLARGEKCATLAHLEAILYAHHTRSLDLSHADNLERIADAESRVKAGTASAEEFGLARPTAHPPRPASKDNIGESTNDAETARKLLVILGAVLGALGGEQEQGDKYAGCCSYHQGVCGCLDGKVRCCDGRASPTCRC